MIKYPQIVIDRKKISENINFFVEKTKEYNIDLMGITKVFSGSKEIAQLLLENGIKYIGDSRIENLINFQDIDLPKVMIRLPMKSQVEEVVKFSDISMNSEISTIKSLNEEAKEQNKIHGIILMIELGDLREGELPENIENYTEEILKLKNINFLGLGVNLTCYGGVIPTTEILEKLGKLSKKIEEKYNHKLEIISGGNSSSIELLFNGKAPKCINNLRLGEVIFFGRESAYGNFIKGCHNDAVILEAEIIELKEKDSVPTGKIGMNAFGETPIFQDKGKMKRAILSIGRQDTDTDGMYPLDKNLEIIGASSDHLILDVTKSEEDLKVGDIVKFRLDYVALLRTSTSDYVNKKFV